MGSRRSRLPAILLSHDFFQRPRNRLWIIEHGAEAVVILQCVWIASSQERGCKLPIREVAGLSFPIPITPERVAQILESAVKVGLLESDGENYYNSRIVADSNRFEAKQSNYSRAASRRESGQNPGRILPQSCHNPGRILAESCHNPESVVTQSCQNHSEYEYEYESEYESESDPIGGPVKATSLVALATPAPPAPKSGLSDSQRSEILATIKDLPLDALGLSDKKSVKCLKLWAQHVVLNLKKTFEPLSAEALIAQYSGRPDDFARDVLASVEGRYRRVYPAKAPPPVPPPKDVRGFDSTAKVLKKITEGVA
jgi:hypothetical protein